MKCTTSNHEAQTSPDETENEMNFFHTLDFSGASWFVENAIRISEIL